MRVLVNRPLLLLVSIALMAGLMAVALSVPRPSRLTCHVDDCPLQPLHRSSVALADRVPAADSLYLRYLLCIPPTSLQFYRGDIEHFELVRQRVIEPLLQKPASEIDADNRAALRRLDVLIRATYFRALPVPTLANALNHRLIDPAAYLDSLSSAVLQTMRITELMEPSAVYLMQKRNALARKRDVLDELKSVQEAAPPCYVLTSATCLARVDTARSRLMSPLHDKRSSDPAREFLYTDSLLAAAGYQALRRQLPSSAWVSDHPIGDSLFVGNGLWLDSGHPMFRTHAADLVFNILNNRVDALTLALYSFRFIQSVGQPPDTTLADSLGSRHLRQLGAGLAVLSGQPDTHIAPEVRVFGRVTCAEFAQATADFHRIRASLTREAGDSILAGSLSKIAGDFAAEVDSQLTAAANEMAVHVSAIQEDRVYTYLNRSPILADRIRGNARTVLQQLRRR